MTCASKVVFWQPQAAAVTSLCSKSVRDLAAALGTADCWVEPRRPMANVLLRSVTEGCMKTASKYSANSIRSLLGFMAANHRPEAMRNTSRTV